MIHLTALRHLFISTGARPWAFEAHEEKGLSPFRRGAQANATATGAMYCAPSSLGLSANAAQRSQVIRELRGTLHSPRPLCKMPKQ